MTNYITMIGAMRRTHSIHATIQHLYIYQ